MIRMAKNETGSVGMIMRRGLPLLIAAIMVLTMGFLPMGEVSAGVNKAQIPKAYKSGYNIYQCIDISNWQGVITKSQFQKLKKNKNITHVIVRVGYTRWASFLRFADASYKQNIKNASAAGLKVGAYYYSQAKSTKEAKKEAQKTIALLKNYKSKITLPVAFDWEWGGRLNASWAKRNGKAANTRICQAFCDEIKKAGYTPMVYASMSVFNGYLNRNTLHSKYKIWMAHYSGGKATTYAKEMYMWQYSSTAQLGTSLTNTKNVDINYVFVKKSNKPGKWVSYSNGRYKYRQDGVFLTKQWLTLHGKKYYLDANGYRVTGYKKIGNYHYGFDSNGVMYKNKTVTIGGNKYRFASKGWSVLYQARVKDADGGYLNRRNSPDGVKSGKKYYNGDKFYVVRKKGDWVQDQAGLWVISRENKKSCLEIIKTWPQ